LLDTSAYLKIKENLPLDVTLVAVSKTKPVEDILSLYNCGQRIFGENKVQELCSKYELLPKDIEWHLIGHLQSNKVKYIAAFVTLIHAVDSLKLLQEIDKQAQKNKRVIDCLLQIFIAKEETKFGFDFEEATKMLKSEAFLSLQHVKIVGLMGMATNTSDESTVKSEFLTLQAYYNKLKNDTSLPHCNFNTLSMGMSNDYPIAIECGSNMVRIGSSIFGTRL
jgi:pyridoxal phosphate enzyme (YggS family)